MILARKTTRTVIGAFSIFTFAVVPLFPGFSSPIAIEMGLALEPPEGEENIPDSGATGGGRNPATVKQVFSLLPDSEVGYTRDGHPTFFVYVLPTDYRNVFFSLEDEKGNQHYHTAFEISGHEQIVAIALPEDLPELEKGKLYRWHFIIYQTLGPDSDRTGGLIRRTDFPLPISREISQAERANLYAQQQFWYDALTVLWQRGELSRRNWQQTLTAWGLQASNVVLE